MHSSTVGTRKLSSSVGHRDGDGGGNTDRHRCRGRCESRAMMSHKEAEAEAAGAEPRARQPQIIELYYTEDAAEGKDTVESGYESW